ncbi:MAG: hypothetical protein Q8880_11605, partial [Bacteroidota bacterium]|nr:hypothetical protein [Bacteroidota bacterium]
MNNKYQVISLWILEIFIFLISFISMSYGQIDAGANKSICIGESITIGPSTDCDSCKYSWSSTSQTIKDTIRNPTVKPTVTTTYNLTVTYNISKKTNSGSVVVTVNELPTISAGADQTICSGITATLTASGGTTYSWSTAQTNPIKVNPTTTTSYKVTGTLNGCTGTAQVVITVNPLPKVSAGTDQTICSGITATLTASGGTTYSWSTAQTINPIKVSPTTTTTYKVTGTTNGCTGVAQVVITVNIKPDAAITGIPNSFRHCFVGSFDLEIRNSSKTITNNSNYEVEWGDGTPKLITDSLPAKGTIHTYNKMGYFYLNLIVTSNKGCQDTFTQKVFNGTSPAVGINTNGNTSGCLPLSDTVQLTYGGNTNPPGTRYEIKVFNGDRVHFDTIYFQPKNPDIPMQIFVYTFDSCSCYKEKKGDPPSDNSFYFRITATNECMPNSIGTIGPIQISQKPIADFSINNNYGCINDKFVIASKITDGKYIRNNICDTNFKKSWEIIPSNYTIVKGSLGSIPPKYDDSDTWGSDSLEIKFTKTGKYSIKLYVESPCGNDTIVKVKEICIDSIPKADFKISNTEGCLPHTVDLTDMSVTNTTCDTVYYKWSIIPFDCNNDSTAYEYLSGTKSSSHNPKIRFNKSGNYKIELKLSTHCGTSTKADTVSIKSKPLLSIKMTDSICEGFSVSPTVNNIACNSPTTTYSWNFAGGNPISSVHQNPGNVSYKIAGNYIVSVKAKNECGVTDTIKTLKVKKLRVDLGVSMEICKGSQTQISMKYLNKNEQKNYTYSWSPSLSLSSTNIAEPTASPTQTTSYNVTITDKGGGCTGTGSIVIKVNPLPIANCDNDKTICRGDTIVLNASVTNGTPTYSYSWSPLNFLNKKDIQSPISIPAISTTYICNVTDKNGCTTTCDIGINVNSLPVLTLSNTEICPGNTDIMNLGVSGNAPYYYKWTPSTGLNATNIQNPVVSTATTTTYTVSVTDKNNCSNTANAEVKVKIPPIVNINIDKVTGCNPLNIIYKCAVVPSGAYSYSWNFGNGETSTLMNPPKQTYTNTSNVNKQYITTLKVNAGINCLITKDTTVTVFPLPIASCSGGKAICNGDSAQLNISATGGNPGYSYLWTSPASLNNPNIFNPVSKAVISTTYTCNVTDKNGCSASCSEQIKVNNLPTIKLVDTKICKGNIYTMDLKVTGSSPYTYSWSTPLGLSSTIVQNPIVNISTTTTYEVTVTDNNNCKSIGKSIVTVNDPPKSNFNVDNNKGCSPLIIHVSNSSIPVNINSKWYLDNAINSLTKDSAITINNADKIKDKSSIVKLIVTSNTTGCVDSMSKAITVYPKPKADFDSINKGHCSPTVITMKN